LTRKKSRLLWRLDRFVRQAKSANREEEPKIAAAAPQQENPAAA
jgi:hypothetical protein